MRKLLIVIITYIYIFSPPIQIIPISISNLLAIWSYLYIIFDKNKISKVFLFKRELLVLILILLYITTIYIVRGLSNIEPVVSAFKLLFIDFPIALSLVLLIEKVSKNNFQNYYKKIFVLSFLTAGLFSIFLLINPIINEYIKTHILRTLDIGTFQKALVYRGFGFSDSLLYSFPIALALGACYILENYRNKFLSIFFILILVIPIFLNARIGLVPLFSYLFFIIIIKRKVIKITVIITIIFFLFQYFYKNGYLEKYSFFIDWTTSGIQDTFLLFQKNEVLGNYYGLSKMIHFPDNILFGSGKYIYTESSINSDIGYILQLYYGGLFYLALIISFFYNLVKRLSKIISWKHWFPITASLTFIVSNIKGDFFSSNPGMRTIIILYVFFIYYNLDVTRSK